MLKRLILATLAAAVTATAGVIAAPVAHADTNPYTQPGDHFVNGRYWKTSCSKYSDTVVRCRTEIWATKVVEVEGVRMLHNGWVFNNMTYLPSERGQWNDNPLATPHEWTAEDGRKWRTECDTPATGGGGCRTYATADVISHEDGRFVSENQWQFNNIVQFSSAGIPPVTSIPAATPKRSDMPVETTPVPPIPYQTCKASYYWQGQRTANGEYFNPSQLTAAHKSLPFNTRVRVVNPSNGRSVVVRINDRGPYISGRCLDLSRAAMQTIGGTSAGVITVKYQVLD